ncbi:M1 family metallopeptidase [Solicola sp. PLA-1-18]|uniref:M1 family metallopeptidase n=1 Tax=Solicola sp. PLA-1-18 TaxID=3380532 RepID=UPI003B8222CF
MSTRFVRALGVLLTTCCLGLVSVVPGPATAAQRAGSTGADGIGDPYFPEDGNGGYQVGHYDIRVSYDHPSKRLAGTATLTARTKQRLTRFNLDLALKASAVTVDGATARFSQKGKELTVSPGRALAKGQKFRVAVTYAGVPEKIKRRGENAWYTTPTGGVVVNQPQAAAWWFPSNDHPADPAAFDVRVTVPKGTEAISNGNLVSTTPTGSQATWHWRLRSRIATYLAFVAIGDYDIEQGTAGGRKYLYGLEKGLPARTAANARRSLRTTPRVTSFLARRWGSYPYGVVGGVVPNVDFGYALENATRPVYSPAFFEGGASSSIVVHEMAHQWFGDKVAVKRWKHIWLNEGYATYSEWLWSQARGNRSTQSHFNRLYRGYEASNEFWDLEIGDPGAKHIFDEPVYDRGAMTLHVLHKRIGDKAFYKLSTRWHRDNADGLGTTREYIDLAEKITGKNLDPLFRQWLFSGKKPTITR